jgi:VWFA-related protein
MGAAMIRVAIALLALLAAAQQVPSFRGVTRRVAVDVAVLSGNAPVPGLTSADFTLADNGILQQIDAVGLAEVPVDVSLVVDVSGSTAAQLETYRRDVSAIAKVVRPIDRLRVIAFETAVREIMPLAPSTGTVPVERLDSGRTSSVYDGIAAALLRRTESGRRHLIVAYTDGAENRSILTSDQIVEIGKSSEAVLNLIAPGRLPFIVETDKPCRTGARTEMNAAPAPPCKGPPALEQVVEISGGKVHVGAEMVGAFKKIFRDYLNSYILYFQPTGVASSGWHELTVKITRRGRFTVHARRGYFAGS